MLEIVLYIIWSGLAVIGIAALLGLFEKGYEEQSQENKIAIVPLCKVRDNTQMIVYDAANCSCKVIILDCGMDGETKDICQEMIEKDERIILCKPEDLQNAIMNAVGLQNAN